MKKTQPTTKALLAILILAVIISVCSCYSEDSATLPPPKSGGVWYLNGVKHSGTVSIVSGNQISCDNDTTSIQVFLTALPTNIYVNYTVVDEANVPAGKLTSTTCAFEINVGTDDIYLSKSESSAPALSAGLNIGKYFVTASGTYKLDHYKLSSGIFVDSTSTCTLISLDQ